jgi:hypothetical protein
LDIFLFEKVNAHAGNTDAGTPSFVTLCFKRGIFDCVFAALAATHFPTRNRTWGYFLLHCLEITSAAL